ncbi:hypothetical protein GQ600_15073 [Phytophthora cactorum]|nr:hypothetical protein GQ600_15073 [Phytophthora cactorum]
MTSGEQSNRAGWIGRLPTASRCASAVHILTNRSRGRDVTDVTSANFQRWTISMHVCRGVLDNTTAEKTKRSSTEPAGAFHELETINGESIAVWLSRAPLQSPICLDALSTQDCMRYLTSMEQRGITGRSTFALLTQDEVTRAHSSLVAAGLLFEQIKKSASALFNVYQGEGVGGWIRSW